MRASVLILASIATLVSAAQEEFFSPYTPDEPYKVRIDAGFSMYGCQGSYLDDVDASNVLVPNRPTKPIQHGYALMKFAEVEVRLNKAFGVLAHYDGWRNSVWQQQGNNGWNYVASARTGMVGGRWYWSGSGKFYSGLMGGWCHHWSTGTEGIPMVNSGDFAHEITLIGVRTQGTIGVSCEIGQGYKGFMSFGLSAAF